MIPFGVLFAGALPEPQAANPSTGTAGEAALTDFRSRLLASLRQVVTPPQVAEPPLVPSQGGQQVVDGVFRAPAAIPTMGPAAAAGDGRVVVQPPSLEGNTEGFVADLSGGETDVGEQPTDTLSLEAPSLQVGDGPVTTAPARVGRPPVAGEAPDVLPAAPAQREGVGRRESAPMAPPVGTSAATREGTSAIAPEMAERVPDGRAAFVSPEAAPQRAAATDRDLSPEAGSLERRPESGAGAPAQGLPPQAGRIPGEEADAPVAREADRAAEAGETQRGSAERTTPRASDGTSPDGFVAGGPAHDGVQGAEVAPAVAGVQVPAEPVGAAPVSAAPQQEPPICESGSVGQRSDGTRRSVPRAFVGAAVAAARSAGEGHSGDEAPEVAEPRAIDGVEPREARWQVVGPEVERPASPAPRRDGDSGSAENGDAGLGQGRAMGFEKSLKTTAEETRTPWGSEVREAAGAGREPWIGRARRFAARYEAPAPEGTAQGAQPRQVLEGAAEVVARARVEVPHAPEPASRGEEAVVTRGRLEEVGEALPRLVVERARLAGRGDGAELRVRLHPPELGEIRVSFRSERGELRGAVAVERQEVKGWVESQLPRWRQELDEAGLKVERLEVALLPRGDGGSAHGMPWSGGEAQRWSVATPTPGFAPGAGASETEPEVPELGVNNAGPQGVLDYWA